MSSGPSPTTPGWYESFYKSSRARTIGVVVIGILALSGAGVLAGALVDTEDVPLEGEVVNPGQADVPRPEAAPQFETPAPTPAPAPTETAPPFASPTPTGGPAPTPSPSPPPPPGDVTTVVLDGGTVAVPIPPPWQGGPIGDGTQATFFSNQGDWVWAAVVLSDPAQNTAQSLIDANRDFILPPETYTQIQTGPTTTQEPFGALLGMANFPYKALYVDSQGAIPVTGNAWVGLRQDGKTLVMTAESAPEGRFDLGVWRPLVDGAYSSFAFPGQ